MLWTILWIIGIPIFYALLYIYLDKEISWTALIWPVSIPVMLLLTVVCLVSIGLEKLMDKFNKYLDKFKDEK